MNIFSCERNKAGLEDLNADDVEDEEIYRLFSSNGATPHQCGAGGADAGEDTGGAAPSNQMLLDNNNIPRRCLGQLDAVRIVRDGTTCIGKGFGFLLFKSRDAARALLKAHAKSTEMRERAQATARGGKSLAKRDRRKDVGYGSETATDSCIMIRDRVLRMTKVAKDFHLGDVGSRKKLRKPAYAHKHAHTAGGGANGKHSSGKYKYISI